MSCCQRSWDFRGEQLPALGSRGKVLVYLPLTNVLFRTSPHHSELLGKQHPQRAKTHLQLKLKEQSWKKVFRRFRDRTHSLGRGEGLGVMRGWQLGCSRNV